MHSDPSLPLDSEQPSHLAEFARSLHAAETAAIAAVQEGQDPGVQFAQFLSAHLKGAAFSSVATAVLVDHSLWRMLAVPELRQAAVVMAPFIDPFACAVEQAEVVAVLGRFVGSDPAVAALLSEIADGSAMGLIALNDIARSKAEEKLSPDYEPPGEIPSQEDDLRAQGV